MLRLFTFTLLLQAVLSSAPIHAEDARRIESETADDWSTIFRIDLQEVRRIILESHPGPVDKLNPSFRDWLDKGFEQQIALADTVDTADKYLYAMLMYVGGFRDGHLNIRFHVDRPAPRWPGFFATWRNDGLLVHTVDPDIAAELAAGDRLESCDGKEPKQLMMQRVFDFQFDPALPAHWMPAAALTFVDLGNPFARPPKDCVFKRDERRIAVELEWQEFSWADRRDDYDAAKGRLRPELGLYEPETGVYWLQAPTFAPDKSQTAAYHSAFLKLREARATAELIVFDLRGNDGGSSMWGELFAESLWNSHEQDEQEDDSYVEWRVSEGNVEYWEKVPAFIRDQFGESHEAYHWSRHVLANLAQSLEDGEALWLETPIDDESGADETADSDARHSSTPAYKGPIAVLTDTTCGSACLDAMSLLAGKPGVVHVGSVTSADTQYMESRAEKLSSGFATLVIPIKVYRGRQRPDGGYYTPEYEFDGLYWTDEAVRAWVLSLWHDGHLGAIIAP